MSVWRRIWRTHYSLPSLVGIAAAAFSRRAPCSLAGSENAPLSWTDAVGGPARTDGAAIALVFAEEAARHGRFAPGQPPAARPVAGTDPRRRSAAGSRGAASRLRPAGTRARNQSGHRRSAHAQWR